MTVLTTLISACMLSIASPRAADFLPGQPDSPAVTTQAVFWAAPLNKFSSIAETFRENHAILAGADYSFNAGEFFANSRGLSIKDSAGNVPVSKTNAMILASLGLMALIARRRSLG